jgi:hypothetical protein
MYVEFNLPTVPKPCTAVSNYWLRYFFVGSLSQNHQINALANTYMRLVEAAIIEYGLGSGALREVWDDHTSIGLGPMHRAISHFESCLTDMHRAINAYRRLRRHKAIDPFSRYLADPKPAFATDGIAGPVRQMRDEIHHLEEKVVDGRISEGQFIALKPDGPEVPHPTEQGQTVKTFDRLVIGSRELTFSSIATVLQEMSAVAARIAQYEPKPSQVQAP